MSNLERMIQTMSNLERMIQTMREEHRLKLNTDYAYILKYGELRILCHAVYKEAIIEYAERFSVKITSIHTYEGG